MPRKRFFFRPMQRGISTQHPSMNMDASFSGWPTKNVIVDEYSIKKRPGYHTADRNLGSGIGIQQIAIFPLKDGTRFTMYLTPTDLCQKETAGSNTWSYKTATYTTGLITGVSGTTVTGDADVNWATGSPDLVAGDKFIVNSDHSASIEEDAQWATIASITDDTHLELTASYANATGAYKIRRVYSTPTNERWSYAIVDDQFFFGNGNTNLQAYSGSNYAADGDTSATSMVAVKPRYMTVFAERLIIADYGTTRDPLGLAWSGNGDPNTFNATDDTSAGAVAFLESSSPITGLGVVGTQLVVYKKEALIFGSRTGVSTEPLTFVKERPGIGCIAPYSIVPFLGNNAFIGREDFYILESNVPIPIGEPIRYKFFDIVGKTQAEKVWGYHNADDSTVSWFAATNEGNFAFIWNYVTKEWTVAQYSDEISCAGRGAV